MSLLSKLMPKIFIQDEKAALERIREIEMGEENGFDNTAATNIAAVYTAAKILAEDVGSFPLNLYVNGEDGGKNILKDDYRYKLLHYNPNSYTSSNTFFSTLEYIRNIKGNAFALIERKGGRISGLKILNPSNIIGYKIGKNGNLFYQFDDGVDQKEILYTDILHFRGISDDGIWGMNPIEKLRLNLSVTYKAFNTIDKFYANNATSPKALETTIPEGVNPKEWVKRIDDFNEKYTGVKNAGKIISLPPFTKLTDVTLNFADAEFISTIRFNVDQIASLFRVPPHLLGNFESSKFNNLEQLQLNYKINTIRPIHRMYRQELEFKLLEEYERIDGMSIEFNTNALMETDAKTRVENYKSLFGIGAITPNQIARWEGYPAYSGGEDHYLMTNLMSVEAYNKKNATMPNTPAE